MQQARQLIHALNIIVTSGAFQVGIPSIMNSAAVNVLGWAQPAPLRPY